MDTLPRTQPFLKIGIARQLRVAREYLQAVAKGIQAIGVEAQIATIDGTSTSGILTYVEQHADVSLIAMASHGRDGVGRWFLGSVASDIIHSLPKPLLLIHPDNNETLQNRDIPTYHTIIVPLDGSMRGEHVLDYVKPLAKTFGATITLVQMEHRQTRRKSTQVINMSTSNRRHNNYAPRALL